MAHETIFRQLFDPDTSVLTYFLGDVSSGQALVIDPIAVQHTLILSLLAEAGLALKYVVRTHAHRPNRIDSGGLCELTGADYLVGAANPADIPGLRLEDGSSIMLGAEEIRVMSTPGHTPGCISLQWRDKLFCGDVMEIGGCGQAEDETDPGQMYDSVTMRIFTLPGETLLYPCHDYIGRTVSSVAEERRRNTSFSGVSRDLFIARMKP
jgi:sulfur dioxygenase